MRLKRHNFGPNLKNSDIYTQQGVRALVLSSVSGYWGVTHTLQQKEV
ncbi:hypothetical protein APHDU1_1310 [Anaplasma phagocytophilum]|uniref:Uncharacterized protein n=1 Tax=Anaplasma phagocytophilum str. NCH-1 TaxID=1359161 RepID=A0A0F3MUF7_ANAPH|nr:hypothetical protein EPHNCH_1637 [Anaplasma phagocytophilum str. NCH-1]KJV65801.1 hypothetical protein EPHNCH_0796 [Anaplasma phagocytophilum str. NCH-1]KJZ98018.1 hypothetical protein APHDU1_1310 [Anaplasma phagocytophilum]